MQTSIVNSPSTLSQDERQRCEVWTRVMGYHRPVSSFNIGKQGEHAERRFFVEGLCCERTPETP
ncbi:anaerobic ribonucleoside-triphosphate reductase [Stenotrophomonas sp. Iso1]|uniref:anaerobic ribonucleoside-triphosphate reductase n=1 Tax=Stenotrophomonas sp. Iso1 TaxID=2977283 RepID=UPI000F93C4DC|nr:anaerobic ribonucleoside-triphosphate reductase [Stenotrophomonas sp. Iso1]